nr:MMPL family transporter [Kribbella qitaiheensis]
MSNTFTAPGRSAPSSTASATAPGVFSGFILSSETLVREIGLGLAFAVFVDAFIVRMTIVPAVMALLGKSAWWLPSWLNRLLPNVDIEGDSLRPQPTAPAPRVPELANR